MLPSDTAVLSRVQCGAVDGRLRVLRLRQRLFKALHSALIKHHDAALAAIQCDDQCSLAEAQIVYGSALIELRNHYDNLDFKTDLDAEYALAKGRSNTERRVPIALTYIVPGSHTLFYSVLSAFCGALEAGSCAVVELKNTSPKSSILLREIITSSLDADAFGVVSTRAPPEFLSTCVIVDQTGSIGHSISAQRVLTSTARRNVAIVDRTCDVALAAREVVASRMMFGGKSCCAVDMVLVNEYVADSFLAVAKQLLQGFKESTMSAHFLASAKRNTSADDEVRVLFDAEVLNGEVKWFDDDAASGLLETRSRTTHLVNTQPTNSTTLPILYNKTTSLDDAIDFLSTGPTPLGALYLFSSPREAKYLSQHIPSQATYVNHIPAQLSMGPTPPVDYPFNLRMRYTSAMFEQPSPQVVPGPRSHLMSTIVAKAAFIDAVARKPLKATGQPKAGAWGFFEQGIVIGLFTYLLPIAITVVGGTGWTVYKGWDKVKG